LASHIAILGHCPKLEDSKLTSSAANSRLAEQDWRADPEANKGSDKQQNWGKQYQRDNSTAQI
jgi:hypothetical protein